MSIFLVVVSSLNVWAEPRYEGNIFDWLFDMSKVGINVATGKYVMDTMKGYQNSNDWLDYSWNVTKDFLGNVLYKAEDGVQAIQNTFFGLPKSEQDKITNFYNTYKNQNVIVNNDVAQQLHINEFKNCILNPNVVIINPYKPSSKFVEIQSTYADTTYLVSSMTVNEISDLVTKGYPYTLATTNSIKISQERSASTVVSLASNSKYVYFIDYTTGSPSVYRNFLFIGSNSSWDFYGVYNGGYYYPTLLSLANSTATSITGYHFNEDSYSPTTCTFSRNDTTSTIYLKGVGTSLTSTENIRYPFRNITIRKITVLPASYPYDKVNNFFNNTQNFYNENIVNYYYNNEYIPAVNNTTNNYYEYVTNDNSSSSSSSYSPINNDYSQVINNYITNNTYGGDTTNVTYVTNIYNPPPDDGGGGNNGGNSEDNATIIGLLTKIVEFFTALFSGNNGGEDGSKGIFDLLGDLVKFLTDLITSPLKLVGAIIDLFKTLFVPSEDFFSNQFNSMFSKVLQKLPHESYIKVVSSLIESDNIQTFDISEGDSSQYLAVASQIGNNLRSGASQYEDISVDIMGVNAVILNAKYLNIAADSFRGLIRAFFLLLLALYNYNQLYFLIRGTYPMKSMFTKEGG